MAHPAAHNDYEEGEIGYEGSNTNYGSRKRGLDDVYNGRSSNKEEVDPFAEYERLVRKSSSSSNSYKRTREDDGYRKSSSYHRSSSYHSHHNHDKRRSSLSRRDYESNNSGSSGTKRERDYRGSEKDYSNNNRRSSRSPSSFKTLGRDENIKSNYPTTLVDER